MTLGKLQEVALWSAGRPQLHPGLQVGLVALLSSWRGPAAPAGPGREPSTSACAPSSAGGGWAWGAPLGLFLRSGRLGAGWRAAAARPASLSPEGPCPRRPVPSSSSLWGLPQEQFLKPWALATTFPSADQSSRAKDSPSGLWPGCSELLLSQGLDGDRVARWKQSDLNLKPRFIGGHSMARVVGSPTPPMLPFDD